MRGEIAYPVAMDGTGRIWWASERVRREDYCCPVCHGPMVLRAGRIRRPHFAHFSGSPGCGGETALHFFGKQVVAEVARREGKAVLFCPEDNSLFAVPLRGLEARMEATIHGIRPDLLLLRGDGSIRAAVEIVVRHEPEEPAIRTLALRGIPVWIVRLRAWPDLEGWRRAFPVSRGIGEPCPYAWHPLPHGSGWARITLLQAPLCPCGAPRLAGEIAWKSGGLEVDWGSVLPPRVAGGSRTRGGSGADYSASRGPRRRLYRQMRRLADRLNRWLESQGDPMRKSRVMFVRESPRAEIFPSLIQVCRTCGARRDMLFEDLGPEEAHGIRKRLLLPMRRFPSRIPRPLPDARHVRTMPLRCAACGKELKPWRRPAFFYVGWTGEGDLALFHAGCFRPGERILGPFHAGDPAGADFIGLFQQPDKTG